MNNLKEIYKAIPALDKVILFAGLIAMLTFILFTTDEVEPLPILIGVLLFSVITHFVVTKTYSTSALLVIIFQAIVVFPVSTFYAFADGKTFSTDGDFLSSIALSALAVIGISYIAAWAVWKNSSGRYWVKLALAYFVLDFIVPFTVHFAGNLNFTMSLGLACVLMFIVCFPWKRISKARKIDQELPYNLERKDITESLKKFIGNIEGVEILPSTGKVVSFVAKKGKHTFHISVLGLNRELKITNEVVRYGNDNLTAYLYQTAIDAKYYKRRNKNAIPVVVNYSDDSNSFAEVNSSLKNDEKRVAMPVVITTPIRLAQIIKES